MTKQELEIIKKTLEEQKIKNSVYAQVSEMALSNAKSSLGTGFCEYTEAWLDIADFCKLRLTESSEYLKKLLDKIREENED